MTGSHNGATATYEEAVAFICTLKEKMLAEIVAEGGGPGTASMILRSGTIMASVQETVAFCYGKTFDRVFDDFCVKSKEAKR